MFTSVLVRGYHNLQVAPTFSQPPSTRFYRALHDGLSRLGEARVVLLPQVPRERQGREDGGQVRVQEERRQAARAEQGEHHQNEEEEDAQRGRGQRGEHTIVGTVNMT